MSNWYEQMDSYIQSNIDDYIASFFSDYNVNAYHSGFHVNPCPFCQHDDCFSITRSKGVKCHSGSCGEKGSKVTILEKMHGKDKARKMLSDWSGIKYEPKHFTPEQREAFIAQQRIDEIYEHAVDWYHNQLMNSKLALGVQKGTNIEVGERAHTEEMLRAFRVGLSGNFKEFRTKMLQEGYSHQELQQANEMIWFPEQKFIYPHFNEKGKLVRMTAKSFIRHCKGEKGPDGKHLYNCGWKIQRKGKEADILIKAHEEESGHKVEPSILSQGTKLGAFFFNPKKLHTAKYAIFVEGEDDVISTEETLMKCPVTIRQQYIAIGTGGNPPIENFSLPFLRRFEKIFEAFDHDDAGAKYREQMNECVPDIPLYNIPFDNDYKDIDKYLKVSPAHEKNFEEMLDHKKALFVDTDKFLIEKTASRSWTLKNRKFNITFSIDKTGKSKGGWDVGGELTISVGDKVQLIKSGFLTNFNLDQIYKHMFYALVGHISSYYSEVPWKGDDVQIPARPFEELVEILRFAKYPDTVRKQIAYYWYHAEADGGQKEANDILQFLSRSGYNQDEISKITKEVTGYKNQYVLDIHSGFPYIQLSSFFHCRNDDAFFYFTKTVKDGDNPPKAVPHLLSNRREEIRLDLIKRSDPQHYLLINQRYALKQEVPSPPFDPFEVSLQQYWVEKWLKHELSDRDIDPSVLIDEIDGFIQRCYYLDEPSRKTLAIWIFSTYFYPLFDSGFPYLALNGMKGTGKSTLDMVLSLLSLNAKLTSSITSAALFRIVDSQGGVLILDEMENMFDRKQTESNDLVAVLKGGYSIGNGVYRTDPDTKEPRRFETFCPKVISNINGVEDVLADRCLFIMTKVAPEEEVKKLEKPQKFLKEYRYEVHNITSRCAISALVHFQRLNQIFQDADTTLETGNIRFGQIMKPLVAMARFVGGDYEEHLMTFYKELKVVRDDINAGTIEGMLKYTLKSIAEEHTDPQKPKWATNYIENRMYEKTIHYDKTTGIFEVDSVHLKLLLEELAGGEREILIPEITKAMKPMLGSVLEGKEKTRLTTITLHNEDLIKRFKKHRVKGYKYYLNVNDYIEQKVAEEPEEALF